MPLSRRLPTRRAPSRFGPSRLSSSCEWPRLRPVRRPCNGRLTVESSSSEIDLGLLKRITTRDETALAALYDRHSRLAYAVIMRILGSPLDAEDVLQETFVRVWSRADTYDAVLGSPATWLTRIARNRAIDRLRARRVRANVAIEPVVRRRRPASFSGARHARDARNDARGRHDGRRGADGAGRAHAAAAGAHRSGVLRGLHPQRARDPVRRAARHGEDAHPRGPRRDADRLEQVI